ncbi:MAG: AmmeMemoRadiSam system protein B [Candidatus Bathyarchaeia archaeon]|nr:AmmeMemoRadiSam system protein B [Candidatus Bathyarchaeota archaeon]
MKVRKPAQAGFFYSGKTEELKREIEGCFKHRLGPKEIPKVVDKELSGIVGLICPHAGYAYSGPVAATAYSELARHGRPRTIVIVGPNHTGRGSGVSLMNEGGWVTPLGEVKIDSHLANSILENASIIDVDVEAHTYEHSIEVQLPFLQYLYGSNFRFVPICMMMQDLETSRELGEAISKVANEPTHLVLASSDMTHYEPHEVAVFKDMKVIQAIQRLDEQLIEDTVESEMVSACGVGPIISAVVYSKRRGATEAKLLSYRTSGEISGDYQSVVGYASMVIPL